MHRSIRRSVAVSVVLVSTVFAGMTLPAEVSARGSHAHAAIKMGGIVTVSQGPKGSWTANFNPWAANNTDGTTMIWEPLLWFNVLKGGKITPWLARSYKWSKGGKLLTFNLRPGVKWNDGKPFTSKDVAWSYQMAKKYPSVGYCSGCAKVATSVTTPNALTVQFHFSKPDSSMLYWIGVADPMPEHVYSGKGDPSKIQIKNPVATGPFMMGSFSPQVFVLKRNPRYWQKGKPYVAGLRYPAYSSNDSAQLALVKGEIQYGGVFIPDAQKVYASKSKYNHFWYSGTGGPVALWMNDAKAPFDNVHVRRAVNLAVDRATISKVAEYSYEPPGNMGVILPGFVKKWADPSAAKIQAHGNITAAKAELAKAGNANISAPMKLDVVSGWSDWVTSVQLIADQLKAIGMNVSVNPLQFSDYLQRLQQGNFDMAISWTGTAGNSPYFLYHDDFASAQTAPIGQAAASNFARYKNSKLDSLLAQYAATTNAKKQVAIIKQASKIIASDVPILSLMNGGNWYEYNDKQFVGWPSAKNPYDWPMPFAYGNGNLDVALHIHLK